MKEIYIPFKLAKLLNNKGLPGLKAFPTNKKHWELAGMKYTTALAIRWIRQTFGFHIHVHPQVELKHLDMIYLDKYQAMIRKVPSVYTFGKKNVNNVDEGLFRKPCDTPEEAELIAIEYCLKNLIK